MEEKKWTEKEKREFALRRAAELKAQIEPYLKARAQVPDGFSSWDEILKRRQAIYKHFSITDNEWQDWRWQLTRRIPARRLWASCWR
jgi:lysine 2,3-aminomutase